jgi:hypothetical protein
MSIARTFVGDHTCARAMAVAREGESAPFDPRDSPGKTDELIAPQPTAATSAHVVKSFAIGHFDCNWQAQLPSWTMPAQ